jgi:glutathione S-transferase
MEATLYSIAISHPARTARLMLDHKGIAANVVDIPPGAQQVVMRSLGFGGGTVPGLKIDGRKVLGSREIARALDEVVPEPALFPSDPALRAAVEEAERWGEEVYQPVPRRIFRWSAASRQPVREALARAARLPAPALTSRAMWPVAQFYVRLEGGGEQTARADVAELPAHLDHVDDLIAAGTIDGEALNAADFQIATTTRVLLNFEPLRHLVVDRPAAEHAMRVVPKFGRSTRIDVPEQWIPSRA